MEALTYAVRKKLKAQAHHLKPVVMIGQKGLTDSLIKTIDKALVDHELIKIKFIDYKDEKKELTNEIGEKTNAAIIGLIGNILILYKENPDKE
jgi:RNA-binding protein